LVKANPETEGGDCIRAEALKAKMKIARFSWGAVDRVSRKQTA
jgi:hypothetical protein